MTSGATTEASASSARVRTSFPPSTVTKSSSPPFDGSGGLLDFVTVDGGNDVRTLAELALASVVAPLVIATGADDPERVRWLARHGASALCGQGLAAPMPLEQLVRWARERRGSLGR